MKPVMRFYLHSKAILDIVTLQRVECGDLWIVDRMETSTPLLFPNARP